MDDKVELVDVVSAHSKLPTLVEAHGLILDFRFDPEKHVILYADELRDTMQVFHTPPSAYRDPGELNETSMAFKSRGQEVQALKYKRWFTVTKKRTDAKFVNFIGVYVDGQQEKWRPLRQDAFYVLKETIPTEPEEAKESSGGLHFHIHLPRGLETLIDYDGDIQHEQGTSFTHSLRSTVLSSNEFPDRKYRARDAVAQREPGDL